MFDLHTSTESPGSTHRMLGDEKLMELNEDVLQIFALLSFLGQWPMGCFFDNGDQFLQSLPGQKRIMAGIKLMNLLWLNFAHKDFL